MRWHDDGFPLIAVFQDPEQRQTGVVVKRLQHEVIKDDEVILLDVVDDLKKASVKFVERYTPDEPVHGEVSPLLYPMKQACLPMAHARNDFPHPVVPLSSS